MKKSCIWYVAGFGTPWEGMIVGNLASAMVAAGVSLRVYVEGGTANIRGAEDVVVSWKALTVFERLSIMLFHGRLWHLWGKAPFWWPLVRLRARTVHTSLDLSPDWKGHPTRLFSEQAREGESIVRPTFELKVAWAGDDGVEEAPALFWAGSLTDPMRQAAESAGMPALPVVPGADLRRGAALLVDVEKNPSNALLAAYLSMQGLPVVARKSPLLTSLLGRGGYVAVREDEKEAWLDALKTARVEARTIPAGARRFLKDNFTVADSVESLSDLYRSVAAGRK